MQYILAWFGGTFTQLSHNGCFDCCSLYESIEKSIR